MRFFHRQTHEDGVLDVADAMAPMSWDFHPEVMSLHRNTDSHESQQRPERRRLPRRRCTDDADWPAWRAPWKLMSWTAKTP
jgi:hypothetical protein